MTDGDFIDHAGVALVSGGTGGIGSVICRMLAARGSDVVFLYRSSVDAAGELTASIRSQGRSAEGIQLELDVPSAVAVVIDDIVSRHGAIHTLVHAAGPLVPQTHLSRVKPTDLRTQLDSEVVGFFNLVHPTLPHLRAEKGSIVAVTTAATHRYPVKDGLSAMAKGAIEQVVYGLAAEEGRFGVRVNAVGPGMLTDGMARTLIDSGHYSQHDLDVATANIPLRRFGTANDIAEAVCFLASDRAGYISGQHLAVDGGYTV